MIGKFLKLNFEVHDRSDVKRVHLLFERRPEAITWTCAIGVTETN